MFASNMHQNEWFQDWFFQNFLGRGSPSPLPRPLPPFYLGLRPRFGLRPQFSGASRPRLGLHPRFSAASRPRFGLRPQLSIGDLDLAPPPQSQFLDPPVLTFFLVTFEQWEILKIPLVIFALYVSPIISFKIQQKLLTSWRRDVTTMTSILALWDKITFILYK